MTDTQADVRSSTLGALWLDDNTCLSASESYEVVEPGQRSRTLSVSLMLSSDTDDARERMLELVLDQRQWLAVAGLAIRAAEALTGEHP